MASLSKACTVVCVVAALGLGIFAASGSDCGGQVPAHASDADTDPVAVIAPLPETISNGTRYVLNGSGSWDSGDSLIINYTWELVHGESTWYLYGRSDYFIFRDQGLYKISLTVMDLWGNTDTAFTAVVSVDDSDFDGMPDWWELAYFDSLAEEPEGDYDADGYTNLQEYADGRDPSVVDPPPLGLGFLEENWMYLLAATAVVVAVLVAMYPRIRKRRKEREDKKIEIAIELEKSLDEE